VTFPPVTVKLVMPTAPTTEKAGGCFQLVGAPGGVVHVSLNFDVEVGTRESPLKTLEHLFAFAPVKVIVPLIVPVTAMPAVVTHGLAELPSVAFTVIFSVVAVPFVKSGGLKPMAPLHAPRDWLQVTLPGSTGWSGVPDAPASTAGVSAKTTTPAVANIMCRQSLFILDPL
jgi:hypothetical protein